MSSKCLIEFFVINLMGLYAWNGLFSIDLKVYDKTTSEHQTEHNCWCYFWQYNSMSIQLNKLIMIKQTYSQTCRQPYNENKQLLK
jgi:hypothetical protein